MMPCKARLDQTMCIGTTQCNEVAPNGYALNEDVSGVSIIKNASKEQLIKGAEACPMGAITVIDTDTGEQLYP